MNTFIRRFIFFAAAMPYAAYGLYFGGAYLCGSDTPENCWPLRLLFFFGPMMGLAWVAALILLLYECTCTQPNRFPSASLGAFLTSCLIWWPLSYGYGRFFRALPVMLGNGVRWTSMPIQGMSPEDGLAYAIFFVGLPVVAAFFGLALFLLLSPRTYHQKVTTFTLFVCAFSVISVLNLSKLILLPYYLWSLFWLLPVAACFVYLRTGARLPKN
ncbi:MAG: hypothetical protein V4476_23475 [Pseudomonadota bacterium]